MFLDFQSRVINPIHCFWACEEAVRPAGSVWQSKPSLHGRFRKKERVPYLNGYFLRTPPETVEMGRGPLRPAARQSL